MDDPTGAEAAGRRREAGDFLRSRRERLTPPDVGLPSGLRRRTPGLRREEVASLAGVGTSWYTWLEQGRDVRPSAELLTALAEALRLDAAERRHLFVLHERPAPEAAPASAERVDEPLRRMLASLTGQPAIVLGRRWDVLAWNRAAEAVYGSYERFDGDERNALYLLFAENGHRRLLVDWEPVARGALAMFRADRARYAGDPDFERLVDRLTRESPEFAAWWPQREVAQPFAGRKRIEHPRAGRMLFEYSTFGAGDPPEMKLVVFTPLEDDGTAGKLERLLAERPEPAAAPSRDGASPA